MESEKINRTTSFLLVVSFLYLWDVAYFLGVTIISRLPHPLSLFRLLGDIEFLRGLSSLLREIIFSFVSGSLIGAGIGAIVLYNCYVIEAVRRLLRITRWFPLLIVFLSPFAVGVSAAAMSSCYYYIAARSILHLERHQAWMYAAREALLQTLIISLIAQLWVTHWRWFDFTALMQFAPGFKAFATIAVLVGLINWSFQSNFDLTASRHAVIITNGLERSGLNFLKIPPIYNVTLLIVAYLIFSLFGATSLFSEDKIWEAIRLSVSEVIGGIILGGLAAYGVFVLLLHNVGCRRLLFPLLPVAHISAVVLWLLVFMAWMNASIPTPSNFLYFWHKVIAVGFLTFFPLIQSLWGLRDRPVLYRALLAIDDALPLAFVAMVLGENYAATQGLGFLMIVANATGRGDKVLAAFFVTCVVLVSLSLILQWTLRKLYSSGEYFRSRSGFEV